MPNQAAQAHSRKATPPTDCHIVRRSCAHPTMPHVSTTKTLAHCTPSMSCSNASMGEDCLPEIEVTQQRLTLFNRQLTVRPITTQLVTYGCHLIAFPPIQLCPLRLQRVLKATILPSRHMGCTHSMVWLHPCCWYPTRDLGTRPVLQQLNATHGRHPSAGRVAPRTGPPPPDQLRTRATRRYTTRRCSGLNQSGQGSGVA